MARKILSIDFDIIMAPSIEIYNRFCMGEGDKSTFDTNAQKYPILSFVEADFEIYEKITSYLIKLSKILKRKQFTFIESHDEVLKSLAIGEKCSLVNIDHHHDLGYGDPPPGRQNFEKTSCANWVMAGLKNNSIKEYKWIRNPDSDLGSIKEKNIDVNYSIDFNSCIKNFNLDNLDIPDEVIICLSPQWVPKKYIPLYRAWNELINENAKEKTE